MTWQADFQREATETREEGMAMMRTIIKRLDAIDAVGSTAV